MTELIAPHILDVPRWPDAREDRAVRAVAARIFSRPRPYTVTSLGGPTLVCAVLDQRGMVSRARRLREALAPVMQELDVADVADLPAALGRFRGRPPNIVRARLQSGEVADALVEGFDALGWGELADLLGGWWPDPPIPPPSAALRGRDTEARNELAEQLAARVELFRDAFVVDPAAWDMPPVDVDRNVRRAACMLLDPGGEVPASSRHPNRIGRLLGAALVEALEQAVSLRGVTPEAEAAVTEAACLVASVAEAVTAREGAGRLTRSLRVPSRLAPPTTLGWWPNRWWPVLDAWGAASSRSRRRVATVWLLSSAAGDVVVTALLWALASLSAVAAVGDGVRSPTMWRQRWTSELDSWTSAAGRVWGLVQSVRTAGERSPCPFEQGLSRVAWGRSWRYGVLPD